MARKPISFTLNGNEVSIFVGESANLMEELRRNVGDLTPKHGCGQGTCGACTVIVDGQQVRSCATPVGDVAGKSVTTIEGLSGDIAKAVTEAWIRAQAPQCGYCQPGFVMAAASVIAADPKQTAEQALAQITNLCRCGTYDAIRLAVGYALASLNGAADMRDGGAAR